jgi:hypothetical protein
MGSVKSEVIIMNIEEAKRRWIYDEERGVLIQKACGKGTRAGRVIKASHVMLLGQSIRVYRVMWALKTGEQPPSSIDHIDGNRNNNKWCNLRAATQRQQVYNTVPANGGCYFRSDKPRLKPWRARIRLPNGKRKIIGDFASKAEAENAYREQAKQIHGEFYYGAK